MPLRQNAEEKGPRKGLEEVWGAFSIFRAFCIFSRLSLRLEMLERGFCFSGIGGLAIFPLKRARFLN